MRPRGSFLQMRVLVGGAIAKGGWLDLPEGATIADALRAAGGFKSQGTAVPANLANVSRPAGWDNQPRLKWRVQLSGFDGFELLDGDGVIFQFHIIERVESEVELKS